MNEQKDDSPDSSFAESGGVDFSSSRNSRKGALVFAIASALVVASLIAGIFFVKLSDANSISHLESKVEELSKQLNANDGGTKLTLSQVNSKVSGLDSKISGLETEDKHLAENIDSLESCVNRYMDVIAGWSANVSSRYTYLRCFTY